MKNIRAVTALCIALLMLMLTFVGCDNDKYPVVTLDKQNGEPNEEVQLIHKVQYIFSNEFPIPSREGWFFNGWFLDKECTQPVYMHKTSNDITIYADWTDSVTFTNGQECWNANFSDLFTASGTAVPYGDYGEIELTLTVTANGDFTGDKSTDEVKVWVRFEWLSSEQFLGEYVSDEVEASAAAVISLNKSNNYSVSDLKVIADKNNCVGINEFTLNWNKRVRVRIRQIFSDTTDTTLQYRHN